MDKCFHKRIALAQKFKSCQKAILALGDETSQGIILALLESEQVNIRVGEIIKLTNLSRLAVSHHLKILKDAGIIAMQRIGTMNFYYMDTNKSYWNKLSQLINHVNEVIYSASNINYPCNIMENED